MTTISLDIRIDWSEMDLFGHVNNVSFFKYQQAARVNYWEHMGINQFFKESKIGPTLASVRCNFLAPLHFPGNIQIQTKAGWAKNSSFQLLHQLFDSNGNLAAEGEDIVVMFDYNLNKKCDIPENIRSFLGLN